MFEFMDIDHREICRRFSDEWERLPPLMDELPDRFREEYDLSGTGHLFVWTVLGRQATDGTIELVSLTIEWLDGRDVLPNDL